jgi:hypothetical protein
VEGRSYILSSDVKAYYSSIARFAIVAHRPTILTSRAVALVGAVTVVVVPLPILVEVGLLGLRLLAVPTRAGIELLGSGFVCTRPGLGPTIT